MEITLQKMYYEGIGQLQSAGVENARQEVGLLIEALFNISKVELLTYGEKKMTDEQYQSFKTHLLRRMNKEPLQYIIGEQEFMGLTFKVTPSVLIPRSETELLVETVIAQCEEMEEEDALLDMCTGSGCIAISLAHYTKVKDIWAVDLSKEALAVAQENAKLVNKTIKFVHSDLFGAFDQAKQWQIIVSNPPYIESDTIPQLMSQVKDYEPKLALDGKADGLYFYRQIAKQAKYYLKEQGKLFFEIGYNQGIAVKNILEREGYSDLHLLKDLSGLDRVVYATLA